MKPMLRIHIIRSGPAGVILWGDAAGILAPAQIQFGGNK